MINYSSSNSKQGKGGNIEGVVALISGMEWGFVFCACKLVVLLLLVFIFKIRRVKVRRDQ